MKSESRVRNLVLLLSLALGSGAAITGQTTAAERPRSGKTPIIIIPGLTGSELVNSKTGEKVWFKTRRAKDDDIRLPISPNLAINRDSLVSKDIILSVKLLKFLPEIEIYERLVDSLQTRGGYRQAKWNTATRRDATDTIFLYPYDWRRDNVESSRLLVRRIEALKRRLGRPNLKFNVVAHSMGGLVARYAAMYGNADLPVATPSPTWAGARHFDKVFLVGTPNQGSVLSLSALLNGFSYIGGGLNLPFIQNISRFDVFTLPSAYQLLPHSGTLIAYDENLKPIAVDVLDPETWDKYDWAIWKDPDFSKKFDATEQKNARAFFLAALTRAKRFHAALDVGTNGKSGVSFYLIGADCKETPAAIMLLRDARKNRWETKFKAENYTRSDGTKVKDTDIKPLLFGLGDSVVTKHSLAGENSSGVKLFPAAMELYQCVEHNKLVSSPEVQDKLFAFLSSTPPVANAAP